MSASDVFETNLLELLFNGTTISGIADNASSSPATSLYLALHTADPGESGDQDTSEADYTGYSRVAVVRTTSGWTVSGDQCVNLSDINFPVCTGGTNTLTHFSIGTASSGAGYMMFYGPLGVTLTVTNSISPTLPAGTLVVTVN